ncbi:MAG: hypothetical protein VKL39_03360 [Leptolyngbyaceae bacterium]|nr:hypothetical protein [Leptolyngbyaceae bacterium]
MEGSLQALAKVYGENTLKDEGDEHMAMNIWRYTVTLSTGQEVQVKHTDMYHHYCMALHRHERYSMALTLWSQTFNFWKTCIDQS